MLLIISLSALALSLALQSSIVVRSSGSIYYPPTSFLFKDDFESGNFGAWDDSLVTPGDSSTVASINPFNGTYHGRFQTNAITSGTKYAYVTKNIGVSEIFAQGYFFLASGLPLDDDGDRFGLIAFEVNGQLQSSFRIYRSGGVDRFSIIGFDGNSTISETTDMVYPAESNWFTIQFYVKLDAQNGEYQAWVNGLEVIDITNIDTVNFGSIISKVRFGLTSTINVQHSEYVYVDSVEVSSTFIGQFSDTFGVIGSTTDNAAITNFNWLFGNQSIDYEAVSPSQVDSVADLDRFGGLVLWTRKDHSYSAASVREFAKSHVVIVDLWEFTNVLYPSLAGSTQTISVSTMTYLRDWGNFRAGDIVDIRNETGATSQLTAVLASGLAGFANTTSIARFDSTRIAFFRMNGTVANSGFYVMDLDATTPETEWTGIWHVFPAIKLVKDFPTGQYARWMANGTKWFDLPWIYSRVDSILNGNTDIARKSIIGYSVNGRQIPALFIGKGTKYAIIDGSIHGNEKTGAFAVLRLAELFMDYYRTDAYWQSKLAEYTVILIPVMNPDGFVADSRFNAHGVDLNAQFPPDGVTTEPEAWALRNLMGNYTPTIYINMHEGAQWYPSYLIIGNYESGTNKALTVNAMHAANNTFVDLRHWGWYTEEGAKIWIGKVNTIAQGTKQGMSISYASYQFQASCMLIETFVWSDDWGSRKSLWGLDYYPTIVLSFIRNLQR